MIEIIAAVALCILFPPLLGLALLSGFRPVPRVEEPIETVLELTPSREAEAEFEVLIGELGAN